MSKWARTSALIAYLKDVYTKKKSLVKKVYEASYYFAKIAGKLDKSGSPYRIRIGVAAVSGRRYVSCVIHEVEIKSSAKHAPQISRSATSRVFVYLRSDPVTSQVV